MIMSKKDIKRAIREIKDCGMEFSVQSFESWRDMITILADWRDDPKLTDLVKGIGVILQNIKGKNEEQAIAYFTKLQERGGVVI